MAKKIYLGNFSFSKLKSQIQTITQDNKQITGLFIPIEQNHLYFMDENTVYMPVKVIMFDQPNKYGQNALIAQAIDSTTYKNASDKQKLEFNNLPVLSYLKAFDVRPKPTDTAIQAQPLPDISDDDLPF